MAHTLEQAEQHLAQDLGFNTGTLQAWVTEGNRYEVRSYAELIAWRKGSEVWVTDKKFSQTTSRHTNLVKRAWGI